MKIKSIAKAGNNLIAVLIEEKDGQERIFWICAPVQIRDQFADALAALLIDG